ncbi:hypothetical protein [Haladaptatus sp. DFWS20]|uniref:hypothetical protein n=1 Tax=Haladaptatus sp. DFWS20 TaxID=3403467 RepID=UPI003EC1219A
MPNTIKRSGDGLALQVTKPARAAGLVEEADDEPTRLADIRVFAFGGLLLVVDIDRITDENIVELATSAALVYSRRSLSTFRKKGETVILVSR